MAPGSGFSSVKQAGAAIVDVTTGANLTAIDLSIDRPAQLVSGDLLVAAVSVRGKPAIDPPSGWQRIHLDTNGTIVELATYVHVATGDEPAAYTWRFSNAQAAAGTIVAVRGAAADPVGDIAGQVNAKSASIAGPASRSDRARSLVLGFFAPARVASVAAPAGMTRLGQASSTAGTYKTTIQVSAASTDEGPVDGPVATADGAAASAAQVLIVRP